MLTPQAVVVPRDAAEVGRLFARRRRTGVPLTFRSGGTSLSGQAVTDGILADTRRHFRGVEVLDDGARVRVQPGATVRQVNARLARHGRKLGPDPASEAACTLGGVVANNSSGMACGTVGQQLRHARLAGARAAVRHGGRHRRRRRRRAARGPGAATCTRASSGCATGCAADPACVRRIEQQFSMKNTMGYGLNSFLDHTRPVDILAHLVVGSEGTLAFIAEIVMRTVPLLRHARTGLLVFDDLSGATGALPALVATGPATIELLDATSLRVGQTDPQADAMLRGLAVDRQAALLVEYQGATAGGRRRASPPAPAACSARLPVSRPRTLAADPTARAALWHIRKGLYAAVAGARPVRDDRAAGGRRGARARTAADLRAADGAVRPARLRRTA